MTKYLFQYVGECGLAGARAHALTQRNRELTEKYVKLKETIAGMRKRRDRTAVRLQRLLKERQALLDSLNKAKAELAESQAEVAQLMKQNQRLVDTQEPLNQLCVRLTGKRKELEAELSALKGSQEVLSAQIAQLKDEAYDSKVRAELAETKIRELTDKNSQLQEENSRLQEENSKLEEINQNYASEMSELESNVQEAEQNAESLRSMYKVAESTIAELRQQLAEYGEDEDEDEDEDEEAGGPSQS